MVWLEEMFMVRPEESGVEGSLFLMCSMKVLMTCSSIILGWGMELVEWVCLLERHELHVM